MTHRFTTIMTIAAAATLLTTGLADAQTSKKVRAAHVAKPKSVIVAEISDESMGRPLTVKKRSFLDPGNTVAVGADTPEYIVANTTQHVPVYRSYNTAFFGESELPGRFDLPPSNPRFNPSSEPRLPFLSDDE